MAVPHIAAGTMQRVFVLAEPRRHVRRREQAAPEIVRPRVIGTLDAIDEVTFGLFADPRPTMAAYVEQRVNLA